MNNLFARRFQELDQARHAFRWMQHEGDDVLYEMDSAWRGWATSVQNLLIAVFGQSGPHYTNFMTAYDNCSAANSDIQTLVSIFSSAKSDFEGGYVFNVELRISGEVFGDFTALARQSLDEGHKDVAAVLACAALEDALKRYAIANELVVADKTMTEVVNALKGAGLVVGAQKAMLDRMPTIRNYALHANWDKISEPDVGAVIGFVEQFLITKFSS
jgi:hypothetical protein